MSHYQPKRTMVFLSTTAEEYGLTNSWYDWCVGAWHFITQKHPTWSGKIAGMLNTEIVGYNKGNLWMLASPEVLFLYWFSCRSADLDALPTGRTHPRP